MQNQFETKSIIDEALSLRWELGDNLHDSVIESIYQDAAKISDRVVTKTGEKPRFDWEKKLDELLTSRTFGFPLMVLMLTAVFWITISGANAPSGVLSDLLLGTFHPALKVVAADIGLPWWLDGLLLDGVYLSMAWVFSVMLPPMAIFFPLFTLLEDFGYLPRVAFNLDNMFRKSGAHGKQALSMAMGAILDGSYTRWRTVMDNCAISELAFEPQPELLSFNLTDHLENL